MLILSSLSPFDAAQRYYHCSRQSPKAFVEALISQVISPSLDTNDYFVLVYFCDR